jgi:hypothetical protein
MFGIRDPEKNSSRIRIPDPWGKKVPDPGSRIWVPNTSVVKLYLIEIHS